MIDGQRLVGMVSEADVARHCAPDHFRSLVAAISA